MLGRDHSVVLLAVVAAVIAIILYAVLGIVVLLAIMEWCGQVTWKGVLTGVAHLALGVIALVAFLYALMLFMQGMGWLGSWLGWGLS